MKTVLCDQCMQPIKSSKIMLSGFPLPTSGTLDFCSRDCIQKFVGSYSAAHVPQPKMGAFGPIVEKPKEMQAEEPDR